MECERPKVEQEQEAATVPESDEFSIGVHRPEKIGARQRAGHILGKLIPGGRDVFGGGRFLFLCLASGFRPLLIGCALLSLGTEGMPKPEAPELDPTTFIALWA